MGWLLLVLALLSLLLALWSRRRSGLPWQRVVYQDTDWQRNDRPLIARQYDLVGKPDYLLQVRGSLIPVEVKPERQAPAPYQSDLMQLAAYCLLVEATTGRSPKYGLLRYATQTFKLPYTRAVRQELIILLQAIKHDRQAPDVARSHGNAARCRGCGFASSCTDSLV
ncbi:MAG: Dna2/Cas4 domain-containing protein [Herpetosiphonaceae bacterium]|nr:Dna2/Cas4 domain-containing protein [Herpetosiphonaceae bacterium]